MGARIDPNVLYTASVKVRYENIFFMVGNQFGFSYSTDKDLLDLISIVLTKLNESLNNYGFQEDGILYIQLAFIKVDSKNISEFGIIQSNQVTRDVTETNDVTESNDVSETNKISKAVIESKDVTETNQISKAITESKDVSVTNLITKAVMKSLDIPVSVNE